MNRRHLVLLVGRTAESPRVDLPAGISFHMLHYLLNGIKFIIEGLIGRLFAWFSRPFAAF